METWLTAVQVMQNVVEWAEPHEHADRVHLGLHHHRQQRENAIVVENPIGETKRDKSAILSVHEVAWYCSTNMGMRLCSQIQVLEYSVTTG